MKKNRHWKISQFRQKEKKVFFDSENDGTAARVIDCMLWFADFRLQGAGGEGK